MTVQEANHLGASARLRVLQAGMSRHELEGDEAEGFYVAQFDSPVHGRMVVVNLGDRGNYGFTLDELEITSADEADPQPRTSGSLSDAQDSV